MKKYFFLTSLLSVSLLGMLSCAQFEGNQTTPAYIQIDKITVEPNPEINANIDQDSNFLHNDISVVGISIGGKDLGVFTLPCTIPVLKEGKHKLTIYPGVVQNGMVATRLPDYPFLERIIIGEFNFVPGTTTVISDSLLKTRYTSIAAYPLVENFENTSSFDSVMAILTDPNIVYWGKRCGLLSCPSDIPYVESQTNQTFTMSTDNQSAAIMYMEFDYKGNLPLRVGMYDTEKYTYSPVYLTLRTTDKWTKMYVVLGKMWIQANYPKNFKLYFRAINSDGFSVPEVYIDNVKFVYYIEDPSNL